MLILQLNSEKTAADKVPIAIGIGTKVHRWGRFLRLLLVPVSPYSTRKGNYLEQETREKSLWYLWFILMAILWQQYCSTAMQQCMHPWPQQSSQVHHATGFSGGFKCEFLIGIEAGFGRYLYSSSLHRTESSGTVPNTFPPTHYLAFLTTLPTTNL